MIVKQLLYMPQEKSIIAIVNYNSNAFILQVAAKIANCNCKL